MIPPAVRDRSTGNGVARSYEGLAAAGTREQEQERLPEGSRGEEGHTAFALAYRQGASLLAGLRPTEHRLLPDLDTVAAGGHLLMACLEHTSLSQPPTTPVDPAGAAPTCKPTVDSHVLRHPLSVSCAFPLSRLFHYYYRCVRGCMPAWERV